MVVYSNIYLFLLMSLIALIQTVEPQKPKQLFPSSKIPEESLSPRRAVVRQKIVLYHNFFRTKVQPTASNMLKMSWHAGAAKQAQAYAEKCLFLVHNPREQNTVPHLGPCGQNIFVANEKTPWFFAVKQWYLEYKNFTYGAPNVNLHVTGHYTQMAWATSFKVGCGIAHCPGGPWGHFYNYICHYCPGGNYDTILQYPYKAGAPCADCSGHCVHGALCSNTCPAHDVFNNCNELVGFPGVCGQGNCNATCLCDGKRLHKNHPF